MYLYFIKILIILLDKVKKFVYVNRYLFLNFFCVCVGYFDWLLFCGMLLFCEFWVFILYWEIRIKMCLKCSLMSKCLEKLVKWFNYVFEWLDFYVIYIKYYILG